MRARTLRERGKPSLINWGFGACPGSAHATNQGKTAWAVCRGTARMEENARADPSSAPRRIISDAVDKYVCVIFLHIHLDIYI